MADIENFPGGDGAPQDARIIPINIEEEMKSSYIDYSMSVIVSRALPDVRDGLKPVQRRVLYGMQELGLAAGRAHKKSARIVGEVLGKYHPHGDQSVYDALVRMAQEFNLRGPLVDGQGNFGSIDGDAAAAMRYTEVRLTRLAEEMLRDLDKETVDFAPNFDGSLEEPTVLPAALPNLLLNGAAGIAVGMATNIPPHNLGETIDGVVAYIDDPDVSVDDLMKHVPAPDFPTGGLIYGYAGVREAYRTGRGRVLVRAKMHEETLPGGRQALIVTEIPYQVNKSTLLEKIVLSARDKRVEGIHDLRDESDRHGMRIVIELKKDAVPAVTMNQLFKFTQLQQTFGVNIVALVNGRPRTLTLKELIEHYVEHRLDVVTRRTQFELRKAEERAHILEGLTIALDHLDEVIAIIRHSEDTDAARQNLMAGVYPQRLSAEQLARLGLPAQPPVARMAGRTAGLFADAEGVDARFVPQPWLSEAQADAILALRLSRLTGLERDRILAEYRDVLQEIERLRSLLASRGARLELIKAELLEIRAKYADPRRTEIDVTGGGEIDMEDLIEEERMVVTISHQGLVKRTPVSEYRQQGRGGRGLLGAGTRDEDFVEHLFAAGTHDYLLFFTDHGQCYWLRVFNVPEGGRTAKGRSLRNLIQIAQDDRVRAILVIKKEHFRDERFLNDHFVFMATKDGLVKKTPLGAFSRPRADGIIAIDIVEGDELIEAHLTDGNAEIILGCSGGRAIRFHEYGYKDEDVASADAEMEGETDDGAADEDEEGEDKGPSVRPMGRKSRGVRGMRLKPGESVIGMVVVEGESAQILTISANGFGKRTGLDEYPKRKRGGQGVYTLKTTEKTGQLVALMSVEEDDELMIGTQVGLTIRMPVSGIREIGRNTQGVRVINLREGDAIADVARVAVEDVADPEETPVLADALTSGDGGAPAPATLDVPLGPAGGGAPSDDGLLGDHADLDGVAGNGAA